MTADVIPLFTADDFISGFAHDFVDFELDGRTTKVRPMTGLELLEGLKRFPLLIGILPGGGDKLNLTNILVDCGKEACAYLVSCTFDKPGDTAFISKVKTAPDAFMIPALAKALSLFLGKNPDDFFMRYGPILEAIWIEAQTAEKSEPETANREGVI